MVQLLFVWDHVLDARRSSAALVHWSSEPKIQIALLPLNEGRCFARPTSPLQECVAVEGKRIRALQGAVLFPGRRCRQAGRNDGTMRAVAPELDKKFAPACVEDFLHRLLGELAMFIELVEWATLRDSSGNSVGVTELATRHPNPAAEVCPTAATAHLRSSFCRLSSAVLCAAELRRQSHHDAVGALSSTRTSAAWRTMPSGGAVVPPSVVTYMTLPTSPGSRPQ
jgi:hypothetical protein